MSTEFTIRNMKREDLDVCLQFFIDDYKVYKEIWPRAEANKYLKELFDDGKIKICAVSDSKIVGFAITHEYVWWDGKKMFLDEIVIDGKHQGKGIGTALYRRLEKDAIGLGISGITLTTYKGSESLRFHRKNGFSETELIHMEKKLSK